MLWEQHLFKLLPQNTKEDALQPVGQNFCFQSTKKESSDPRLGQDALHHLRIAQLVGMRLFVDFDDANGVGAGVAHSRAAKAQ